MQGFADLMTGLMGALGSTLGGIVLQSWGFAVLNAAGAVLILGPLAAVWLGRAALAPQPPERSGPQRRPRPDRCLPLQLVPDLTDSWSGRPSVA